MGNDSDFDALSHVQERDVDLLLLEEFLCNDDFLRWFVEAVAKCSIDYTSREVCHSVFEGNTKDNAGETDLRIKLESESCRHLFLVENKISADFMPEQAERYRARANHAMTTGEVDNAHTVLVAPEGYVNDCCSAAVFDHVLSYEQICTALSDIAFDSTKEGVKSRLHHREMILRHAIKKHRRGGIGFSVPVTDFFNACCDFVEQEYGQRLRPRRHSQWRPNSNRLVFDNLGCERLSKSLCEEGNEVWFSFLLREGQLGLRFHNWPGKADSLELVLNELKEEDMKLIRVRKSDSLEVGFLGLPSIDPHGDFVSQIENFRSCLEHLVRLADWLDAMAIELEQQITQIDR